MDKQSKMQELDAWSAENPMGWEMRVVEVNPIIHLKESWWCENEKPIIWVNDWHPKTDIAQAFEVLDKFDDWLLEKAQGKYGCTVWDNKCHRHSVMGQAPALAICLACRKAWEAK